MGLLERLRNGSSEFSLLHLLPVLDLREDKLCEVRGEFGYEVKLTKVEHRPFRDRDDRNRGNKDYRKNDSGRRGNDRERRSHSKERRKRQTDKVFYVKVSDGDGDKKNNDDGDDNNKDDNRRSDRRRPNKSRGGNRDREEEVYVKKVERKEDETKEGENGDKRKSKSRGNKNRGGGGPRRKPVSKRDRSADYEFVPKTSTTSNQTKPTEE